MKLLSLLMIICFGLTNTQLFVHLDVQILGWACVHSQFCNVICPKLGGGNLLKGGIPASVRYFCTRKHMQGGYVWSFSEWCIVRLSYRGQTNCDLYWFQFHTSTLERPIIAVICHCLVVVEIRCALNQYTWLWYYVPCMLMNFTSCCKVPGQIASDFFQTFGDFVIFVCFCFVVWFLLSFFFFF